MDDVARPCAGRHAEHALSLYDLLKRNWGEHHINLLCVSIIVVLDKMRVGRSFFKHSKILFEDDAAFELPPFKLSLKVGVRASWDRTFGGGGSFRSRPSMGG